MYPDPHWALGLEESNHFLWPFSDQSQSSWTQGCPPTPRSGILADRAPTWQLASVLRLGEDQLLPQLRAELNHGVK